MSYTDYEILTEIEDIFKKDYRTKEYTILSAADPDEPPDPNSCPAVNIFPVSKERTLIRTGKSPYVVIPTFDIICWEYSEEDYKDAFSRIVLIEENVFDVLVANKNLNSKVLTSTIGVSQYQYLHYEGWFIRVITPFLAEMNR